MKLGIIQGRLTPPVENKVQEFPISDWESEFVKLNKLGLNHIEFIITTSSFESFKNLDISKYTDKISALCCDNLISGEILEINFLMDNLIPICKIAEKNKIWNLNIPLLENSSLTTQNLPILSKNFKFITDQFKNLRFNFEIESKIDIITKFLQTSDDYGFVYDTGNMNFLGVNHEEYINILFKKINQIHLKDRDLLGSHFPGDGTTEFAKIFSTLKKLNYSGLFTIQTKRGETNFEEKTVLEHSEYFKTLWYNDI